MEDRQTPIHPAFAHPLEAGATQANTPSEGVVNLASVNPARVDIETS